MYLKENCSCQEKKRQELFYIEDFQMAEYFIYQ
jgi:hypothetical protein